MADSSYSPVLEEGKPVERTPVKAGIDPEDAKRKRVSSTRELREKNKNAMRARRRANVVSTELQVYSGANPDELKTYLAEGLWGRAKDQYAFVRAIQDVDMDLGTFRWVLATWREVVETIQEKVPSSIQRWLQDLYTAINSNAPEPARTNLTSVFQLAATNNGVFLSVTMNPAVYTNVLSSVLDPLTSVPDVPQSKKLAFALRESCHSLTMLADRELLNTRVGALSLYETLRSAKTPTQWLQVIRSVYAELLKQYVQQSQINAKIVLLADLYKTVHQHFYDHDSHDVWEKELQRIQAAGVFERQYKLLELLRATLSDVTFKQKDRSLAYNAEISELLRDYGDRLSAKTRSELEKLLSEGRIGVTVTQATAVRQLISDLVDQHQAAEKELARVSRQLEGTLEEIERVRNEEERVRADSGHFQAMGPALAKVFARIDSQDDRDAFDAAWSGLLGDWYTAAKSVLMLNLLALRAKYTTSAHASIRTVLSTLIRFNAANVTPEAFRAFIATQLSTLEANIDPNIDERDWHGVVQTWRAVLEADESGGVDAIQTLARNLISRQIGANAVDFSALRDLFADYTKWAMQEKFANDWASAFDGDHIDVNALKNSVVALLDRIASQSAALSTLKAEYAQAQDALRAFDAQITKTRALVETLERQQDIVRGDQSTTSDRLAAAQQVESTAATQSAQASTSYAEAIARGEPEALRGVVAEKKRAEQRAAQRVNTYQAELAELNSRMNMIVHDVAVAKQQLSTAASDQERLRNSLRAKAIEINERMHSVNLASFDNVRRVEPASIEWFDKVIDALDSVQRASEALKTQRDALAAQVTQLTTERNQLSQRVAALDGQNAQLTAQLAAMQQAQKDLVANIDALYRSVTASRAADDTPVKQLSAIKTFIDQRAAGDAALAQLRSELDTKGGAILSLQKTNRQLVNNAELIKQQLEQTQAQIAAAQKSVAESESRERSLQEMIDKLTASQKTTASTSASASVEYRQREETLKAQLDTARDETQQLRTELQELKTLTTQNDRLSQEQRRALLLAESNLSAAEGALSDAISDRQARETIPTRKREVAEARKKVYELKQVEPPLHDITTGLVDEITYARLQLERKEADVERLRNELQRLAQEHAAAMQNIRKTALDEEVQDSNIADQLIALRAEVEKSKRGHYNAGQVIRQKETEIQRLTEALEQAEANRRELAKRVNLSPADVDAMLNRLDDPVSAETVEALRVLLGRMKAKDDDDVRVSTGASAFIEAQVVGSVQEMARNNAEVVKMALEVQRLKKERQLMKDQQRSVSKMSADEEPVFTRLVAPRAEVSNAFNEGSHPNVVSLFEVDDPYEHFEKTLIAVNDDAEIPKHVIDQFYVFAGLVQGRVASARSFWLSEHPGMKALVAHAIEASTKTTQTSFLVRETKQAGAARDVIDKEIVTILKNNQASLVTGQGYSPRAYADRVIPVLNAKWPGMVFSLDASRETPVIQYTSGRNREFNRALVDAFLGLLRVQQPGKTVTRASHMAVIKYIKDLFRNKQQTEIRKRVEYLRGTDSNNGTQLFSILMSFVDKTFYSSLQLAMQYANIPPDFSNPKFVAALYDGRMADYVAALYNQAFARSRHTITAKRTTLIDAHVSVVLQQLVQYKPPSMSSFTEVPPLKREAPAGRTSSQAAGAFDDEGAYEDSDLDYTEEFSAF